MSGALARVTGWAVKDREGRLHPGLVFDDRKLAEAMAEFGEVVPVAVLELRDAESVADKQGYRG